MLAATKSNRLLLTLRTLTLFVGVVGIYSGSSRLPSAALAGTLWDLEDHLLRFETYKSASAASILQDATAGNLSLYDDHSERALLLLEIPLADEALRSGHARDFEQHIRSLQSRIQQALSYSPRDSFVWLVAFGLEIEQGNLDGHAFDLLAMSYETSPTEAWIGARRMAVALPVVLSAPEPLQKKILEEFRYLIEQGFIELPALAYWKTAGPARLLLENEINKLDRRDRQAFSEVLDKFRQ